jgi:predicted oxidoreductase
MAPKKSFRKAYVGIVMDMALARSKISNRMVAQRLGVDETTIRRWRKENIEFERAFTEAREALREKINRVAGKSLDVRKRKVVTTSPDGVKTTIEDVLPTHNDIAVFSKVLGLGTSVYSEEERQRDVLREVMKHKVAGKYSALEAAQLLEAEGVKVPTTLLMELGAPKIFEPFNNMDEAAKADTANLTPQEAADIYKKYLG